MGICDWWEVRDKFRELEAAISEAAGKYEPPECCGQTCGWDEREGFWICQYRSHHRYNDFGERVDEYGDTELQAEIAAARRAHPSRSVG